MADYSIANNAIFFYLRIPIVMFIILYALLVIIDSFGVVDYGVYQVGGIVALFSF